MKTIDTVTATDNTINLDDLARVTGGVRAGENGQGCTGPGCHRPVPFPFPGGPRPSPFPFPRPKPFPFPGGPRDPLGPILGGGER